MERIYETEKFKGHTNVDYDELQEFADELKADEFETDAIVFSYARVSTPKQIKSGSLMLQHKSNIEKIRENFDNDIVYVTEIGSGAAQSRDRLLHKVVEIMPKYSFIFAAEFDRLMRDIKSFLPTARLIDQKGIWLFVKLTGSILGENSGKYHLFRQGNFASTLEKLINKN